MLLFENLLKIHEKGLAWNELEKGRFRDDYFSPYKIATIPHQPWQHKPIPVPHAIRAKVSDIFVDKIKSGVYERSQSSYCSRWFGVQKKNGSLRVVHDLQPLNAVTIRDTGVPPILEEFVEGFTKRACYTIADIFVGYDNRTLHEAYRELTAFQSTDHGLLQLCVLPQGFSNAVAEFQTCMLFILQDEIPRMVGVFHCKHWDLFVEHGVKPVERAWVPVYSAWDTSLWSMGHQSIERAPAIEHGTTPVQKTIFPCYLNWLYQSHNMRL